MRRYAREGTGPAAPLRRSAPNGRIDIRRGPTLTNPLMLTALTREKLARTPLMARSEHRSRRAAAIPDAHLDRQCQVSGVGRRRSYDVSFARQIPPRPPSGHWLAGQYPTPIRCITTPWDPHVRLLGVTVTITVLNAEEIAERQLLAALKLWHEHDYVSSLTLAGAAEEILGKRLRKLGAEPSFDQMKAIIVALSRQEGDTDPNLESLVAKMLNSTRNELKHYAGDESLSFDLRSDCQELIERALGNYQALTGNILGEAMDFWATIGDT